jgi:hypothetical protein
MSALILFGYPRDPAKLVFPAEPPAPARHAPRSKASTLRLMRGRQRDGVGSCVVW